MFVFLELESRLFKAKEGYKTKNRQVYFSLFCTFSVTCELTH